MWSDAGLMLDVVAINCVILFHTYLLVPSKGCSPAVFSSGSPSLASSEFSFESAFFNMKTDPGISESHQHTVVKIR